MSEKGFLESKLDILFQKDPVKELEDILNEGEYKKTKQIQLKNDQIKALFASKH